jgi:hypothetical protein
MPDLKIDLNLLTDTIYVYNYSTVKLTLTLTNKTLYAVKFFVNNAEVEHIDQPDENTYSFSVNMAVYLTAKIRAEIYTSTGTHSIADKVMAEAFVYKTKEWLLIYTPEKPEITSEIVNGRLKLSWTPIKSSYRGKYLISGSIIDSTYDNWYIDSSFFGGSMNYCIRFDDNGASGYSICKEIYYPYPHAYINDADSFLIYWEKCNFYNNIKGYRIRINNESYVLNAEDTSFVYKNGSSGSSIIVRFDLLLKDFDQDNSKYLTIDIISGYFPSTLINSESINKGHNVSLSGSSFYYFSSANNELILSTNEL